MIWVHWQLLITGCGECRCLYISVVSIIINYLVRFELLCSVLRRFVSERVGPQNHSCAVAGATTASGVKSWPISILSRSLKSQQLRHQIYTVLKSRIIPFLNGCHQFQVDEAFLVECVTMHVRWRHNSKQMYTKARPCQTHVNNNVQMNAFCKFESVNRTLPPFCMPRRFVSSAYKVTYDNLCLRNVDTLKISRPFVNRKWTLLPLRS